MGVEMANAGIAAPAGDHACLGQIGNMARQSPVGPPADAEGQTRRAQESFRIGNDFRQHGAGDIQGFLVEDIAAAALLLTVGLVGEIGVGVQGIASDFKARRFMGPDLPPDEAMADRGISVDQIGDLHGRMLPRGQSLVSKRNQCVPLFTGRLRW